MENKYFEDGSKPSENEDEIIKRIKECELVIDSLEHNAVWQIVIQDAQRWKEQIDNVWQEIFDEEKLLQARVIKTAYNHITALPSKYKETLVSLQENLKKESEIEKDY